MVSQKLFLVKKSGYVLTELLIATMVLALLALMAIVFLNPAAQIGKARDAKRRESLRRIQTAMEDYYSDKKCYPSPPFVCDGSFSPYLEKIPCDPAGGSFAYTAQANSCPQFYRVYAKLETVTDPEIQRVGCESGCGPELNYNYGVSSSNVGLETIGP